jgi:hypothetical protein
VIENKVVPAEVQPVFNVAPAAVKLELPARKTETTIERDQYGNLVKATQVEKDSE